MMTKETIRSLSIMLSTFHAAVLNYLTVVPRSSQKQFRRRTALVMAALGVLNLLAIRVWGLGFVSDHGILLFIVPCLAWYAAASKYRDGRLLLGIFLGDVFSTVLTNATGIVANLLGDDMLFLLLSWALLFPLAEVLFVRFALVRYRRALAELGRMNWWVISAVSVLYYVIFAYTTSYPAMLTRDLAGLPLFLLLVLLTLLTFAMIYYILRDQLRIRRHEQTEKLLSVQVQAFESTVQVMERSEASLRILRHDMRHYQNMLRELLQSGDTEGALKLLGGIEQALDRSRPVKYCEEPALNAVLRYYVELAQVAGCKTTTRIRLTGPLPVEAADLCIVLANALENAINACKRIEDAAGREITITCVDEPTLALGVYNTYAGSVTLDSDGLPVSTEQDRGHGYGVQSIVAFARKHGALLDYDVDEKWFKMRLVLNQGPAEKQG